MKWPVITLRAFTKNAYIYPKPKHFTVAPKSKTPVQATEPEPEIKAVKPKVPAKRKSPAKISVSKLFPEKEIPMAQIERTNVDHHMAKKYLTQYLDRIPTDADIDKATIIKKSDSISYLKYGGKFLGTMTKTIYQTPEQKKAGKGIGVKMEFKPK
jgi:aspartyl/asparaginyl beta-hydroxylase (cupin superfamily)